MMEKKKRSRDELRDFNSSPDKTISVAKKDYVPSHQRQKQLSKEQTAVLTRRPTENWLNEKRRKITPEENFEIEEESLLETTNTSFKHYEKRRAAIEYLFRLFDSIPENEWEDHDLIAEIMKRLSIPKAS